MKLLKTGFILLSAVILLSGCKEAIDKRKIDTQTTKNTLIAIAKDVSVQDFKNLISTSKDVVIIDVRPPKDYEKEHIPNAIYLDWAKQDAFSAKLASISKDKTILVYCNSGHRSGLAKDLLQKQGYQKVYNLESGIIGWKAANFAVEK